MLELNHHYVITLRKAPSNDGGGYIACIPQLGFGTFNAQADTIEETIDILNDVYNRIGKLLDTEKRWERPEPIDEWEISQRVNPPSPYSPFKCHRTKVSPHDLTTHLRACLDVLVSLMNNPYLLGPDSAGDDLNSVIDEAYRVRYSVEDLLHTVEEAEDQYLRWIGR